MEYNLYKLIINYEKNICLRCLPIPKGIWSFNCDFCIDRYLHCDVCGETVENVIETITFKLNRADFQRYKRFELNSKFKLRFLKNGVD